MKISDSLSVNIIAYVFFENGNCIDNFNENIDKHFSFACKKIFVYIHIYDSFQIIFAELCYFMHGEYYKQILVPLIVTICFF